MRASFGSFVRSVPRGAGAILVAALLALLPAGGARSMGVVDPAADVEAIAGARNLGPTWFLVVDARGRVIADVGVRGADPKEARPIGGLSNSITAIATAALIQDGKLSLRSTVGRVLAATYRAQGLEVPPSLADITVERLLSHTAGLRSNVIADPVNGLRDGDVLRRIADDPTPLNYLIESGENKSNGSDEFAYANLSYLILGMMVDAASGEAYDAYCRRRIFEKAGVADARTLDGSYRAVTAFTGWSLTRGDLIRVWRSAFDAGDPRLLSASTLSGTLLAPLGQPLGGDADERYTLGVRVRRDADGGGYRVRHNGLTKNQYSYAEADFPGAAWMVSTTPIPPREEWGAISDDFRSLVTSWKAR